MKCSICGSKIETTFLNKLIGTYIDKKPVCNICQKRFPKKEDLLKQIKK